MKKIILTFALTVVGLIGICKSDTIVTHYDSKLFNTEVHTYSKEGLKFLEDRIELLYIDSDTTTEFSFLVSKPQSVSYIEVFKYDGIKDDMSPVVTISGREMSTVLNKEYAVVTVKYNDTLLKELKEYGMACVLVFLKDGKNDIKISFRMFYDN